MEAGEEMEAGEVALEAVGEASEAGEGEEVDSEEEAGEATTRAPPTLSLSPGRLPTRARVRPCASSPTIWSPTSTLPSSSRTRPRLARLRKSSGPSTTSTSP